MFNPCRLDFEFELSNDSFSVGAFIRSRDQEIRQTKSFQKNGSKFWRVDYESRRIREKEERHLALRMPFFFLNIWWPLFRPEDHSFPVLAAAAAVAEDQWTIVHQKPAPLEVDLTNQIGPKTQAAARAPPKVAPPIPAFRRKHLRK